MQYLSKKNKSYIETFSKIDLWKLLGMINEKYDNISNEELSSKNTLFTTFEIKSFYMRANQKLQKILISALNNLSRRCLIDWDLVTVVCCREKGKYIFFDATEEDRKEILNAKRDMLANLGINNLYQVFVQNKQKEYFEGVNKLLSERMGWSFYFKRYRIIFDVKHVREAIPETEFKLNQVLLNKEVLHYLNDEAQRQYDKSIKTYNDNISNATSLAELHDAKKAWKLPKNYVIAQELLANELIKIDDEILYSNIDIEDDLEAYLPMPNEKIDYTNVASSLDELLYCESETPYTKNELSDLDSLFNEEKI